MKRENIIQNKSFNFSLTIIQLYKQLIDGKEYVVSKQLLKSGTSIGANVEEASAAQSRRDFISKMSIASKEARETRYWLKLLAKSELTDIDVQKYLYDINQIVKILTSIVKTAQKSLKE